MAVKCEVVFDFFEMEGKPPFEKKERAITWVNVDGKDVRLQIQVPSGHPESEAYRSALQELASALSAGRVRGYGPRGWVTECEGKEAWIGDCVVGYVPEEEDNRPNIESVASALENIETIRVPHVPWPSNA